jgi:hypothetical protein
LLLICKFENLLAQSFAARILSEEKGKMAGEASCLFSANTPPLSATPAGLLNTKIWIEVQDISTRFTVVIRQPPYELSELLEQSLLHLRPYTETATTTSRTGRSIVLRGYV